MKGRKMKKGGRKKRLKRIEGGRISHPEIS